MQVRIFSLPLPGSETANEELNKFLRSKKVLQVESEIIQNERGAFWCFCIRYLEEFDRPQKRKQVDYKAVLDEASFKRFAAYREIRRKLAAEEGIPAFAVFTNEEMAEISKIELLTEEAMKKIKGIGEQKAKKYAEHFIKSRDEASLKTD